MPMATPRVKATKTASNDSIESMTRLLDNNAPSPVLGHSTPPPIAKPKGGLPSLPAKTLASKTNNNLHTSSETGSGSVDAPSLVKPSQMKGHNKPKYKPPPPPAPLKPRRPTEKKPEVKVKPILKPTKKTPPKADKDEEEAYQVVNIETV